MTDLITRLRGPAPSILAMRDAADEIERLKIDLRDYMLAANAEATEVNQCYETLAASQERAKALEDVLRPFARFGIVKSAMRNQPKTGGMYAVHTILGRAEIAAEDFSRAAALLEKP